MKKIFIFTFMAVCLCYFAFGEVLIQETDAASDGSSFEGPGVIETTEITTEQAEALLSEEEHTIENFPLIIQTPELPTGCEITAATMMMNYYGFNADKETMAEILPKIYSKNLHCGSDGRLYGADLNSYFLGSPWSELGCICGAQAIVKAVNDYIEQNTDSSMRAVDITGTPPETLYGYVSDDIPVTVWHTMYMTDRYPVEGWYTEKGEYVDWSRNDHCCVLIGYDKDNVVIADPLTGIDEYSRERFESVYASRGSKCVIIEDFQ